MKVEVEVGGRKYVLRELTLDETSKILESAINYDIDELGRIKPRIKIGEMRLLLLKHCIEEPSMTEAEIRQLPISIARRLLDECVKLNPDFKGV